MLCLEKLQSLFTWIFYLFFKSASLLAFFLGCFNPYSPGFSIYFKTRSFLMFETLSFNPYSPGFSIYLNKCFDWEGCYTWLQSLFTWIFYLFTNRFQQTRRSKNASILIHLDFLSIQLLALIIKAEKEASILIHLDFLSISYYLVDEELITKASILIHLDFLSIYKEY